MLPLNCKIVSWCFLVLLLLDIGCQVTAVEYTFKHRYSYKKKRDDKRYKNAKQRCDMSGQCQGIYGIELTRCLRQCMSKRCYNELYADDKLEEEMELLPFKQGAEARLYTSSFYGKPCIVKERFSKSYRHPKLDKSLTTQRIKAEVRAMLRCRTFGIPTPTVYFVNLENNSIYMEHMKDAVTLRQYIEDIQLQHPETFIEVLTPLAGVVGKLLAKMHSNNIVHGDLTTSNMLLQEAAENSVLVLIDFGLSYGATLAEDKGVDLYVLERALLSTHPNTECLFETILISYKAEYKNGAADVISKLDEIRLRGRKRTMVG